MMNNCIVRADHYPDGCIIPLGFTDQYGKTVYIDRVLEIKRESPYKLVYRCKTKDKEIILLYQGSKWIVK